MKYEESIECSYCNYKGTDFKVVKEWAHGLHLVNRLVCPKCSGDFRYYWGEKKDGTKFNYTIPSAIEPKR